MKLLLSLQFAMPLLQFVKRLNIRHTLYRLVVAVDEILYQRRDRLLNTHTHAHAHNTLASLSAK